MSDTSALVILIAAIFTNNILLANFLGMCSFLACSGQVGTAVGGEVAPGVSVETGGRGVTPQPDSATNSNNPPHPIVPIRLAIDSLHAPRYLVLQRQWYTNSEGIALPAHFAMATVCGRASYRRAVTRL